MIYNREELREQIEKIWQGFDPNVSRLSSFERLTSDAYKNYRKDRKALVEYVNKTESTEDYPGHIASQVEEELQDISFYTSIMNSMAFIYVVSQFEAFYMDVFRVVLSVNYKKLLNSDEKVSYSFALKFEDRNALLNAIIMKELNRISFKSLEDQFREISKEFNFTFENKKMNKPREFDEINSIDFARLNEISATRNILLHNRGIINEQYLKNCPDSQFKIHDQRDLPSKYINDTNYFLWSMGYNIYQSFKDKYLPEE